MRRRAVGGLGGLMMMLLLLSFPSCSLAQDDSPVLAPHKPVAPKVSSGIFAHEVAEHRSMVGGPWMLDPNMKSTLYIRNNIETDSMDATPVLYLSNGKRIGLPAVHLGPAATANVSIGDALLKQGIAPYANLKGYIEIDYISSYDPLCATVVSVDTVHSVIFTYGFRPTAPAAITLKATGQPTPVQGSTDQRIDGIWWKHSATVSGFVSLSNTTDQNISAQLKISGSDGTLLGAYPVLLPAHTTDVIDIAELRLSAATAGGVQLTYHASSDSILISGGMEDISNGYSATMSFRPYVASVPSSTPKTSTLTELGLMTGAPDPMMLFPTGTEFSPFSVIRNVSAAPVLLIPEVFWMDQGAMHRQAMPALKIPSSQTVLLDMQTVLKQAGLSNYNGMLNLTFKTTSSPSAVLLASGSVDQTGTYVFQVLPHEVRESMAKTIAYWSTGNGDDTMVTIWNPADEAQNFLLTLHYSGGKYVMPLHLEARATRFLNIASIIHDQIPDAKGNVIPTTVASGSARLSGMNADNERILVDLDAGSYNVRKATCWYYCISCDGAVNALIGQPVDFSLGTQHQMSFVLHQNTGYDYDYSNGANWSSDNTYVATIAQAGMANSVSVGNFNGNAYLSSVPIYSSYYCAYNASCPDEGFMSGSGGGTVNNYNLTVTGSSPITYGAGGLITITGTGFSQFTGTPTITIPGVQVTNPSVASDSVINATYLSSCSSFVGGTSVTVTFTAPDSSTPQASGPGSITLPSVSAPTIMFGGSMVTGTQSVVVGQQIALTSGPEPTLPNCIYFYNTTTGATTYTPQWGTPTGTAVGGYSATVASGSVTSLSSISTSAPSYTYYWITQGNSLQETLTYYYAGGGAGANSPPATATFNVSAPNSPSVTSPTQNVVIGPAPNLEFGLFESGGMGIAFTGTANQTSGGNLSFVQLINYYDVQYFNGDTCIFSVGTGLDNTYPYPSNGGGSTISTDDSPSIGLYSNDTEATVSFGAIMYFMWQSNTPNSIPVPLGSVSWQWTGDAVNNGSLWALNPNSNNTGSSNGFVASNAYPEWSTHVTNGVPPCH